VVKLWCIRDKGSAYTRETSNETRPNGTTIDSRCAMGFLRTAVFDKCCLQCVAPVIWNVK